MIELNSKSTEDEIEAFVRECVDVLGLPRESAEDLAAFKVDGPDFEAVPAVDAA